MRITLTILLLSVFMSGDLWAASGANPVGVHGDRLSVHAEGMALGELLMVVEDMTGVQFTFDELVAEKKIFLDFEGLPLSEGIKKIIYPLSYAAIYDDIGKLRKVIILGPWKDSGERARMEMGNESPQSPRGGPLGSISFKPKGDSYSSKTSQGRPLVKRPVQFDAPSGNGPPNTQNKIPEDLPVPSVEGSGHLPIPDSEGASVEVPPVGKADSGGTPPDSRDEILEDLPIPGVAASDHLPIPDS